ncbi:MAG TPA: 16S rRNA (cytidine(1402)-2'-O)-methyltransferase [Burkholderiales bacterium]|nr:16S rRNA (cytidine(1402)-2'-O)-methyltransferase [Burkholderiales bacterium]
MQDISLRALDVLKRVDVVAAEDTRNTSRLLKRFAIAVKLIALHQHNEKSAAARIVALLRSGKSVAVVSDAGTPAISDPGALVVERVRLAGFRVVPVPGANAAVTALSAAGLESPHFLFYGFLPSKPSARLRVLQNIKTLPYTLVFYEAPHRIIECVSDMQQALGGERRVVIARELTKLFETIHSCTLGEAAEWLNADPNRLKGEFVLLVSGVELVPASTNTTGAERILKLLLAELPLKQAVKLTAEISGANKKTLYAHALRIKGAAKQV